MDNTLKIQNYSRRRGTDDVGKDYEMKITALLALRLAAMKDTKELCMASNAEFAGDFDDVIVFRQTYADKWEAFLMQLKHQESPVNIKQGEFTYSSKNKSKENFSLNKYSVSFRNLRDKLSADEDKTEIIEFLRSVDSLKYVLFTNRGVDGCDFLNEDATYDFLSTSSAPSIFKFDASKLGSDYDVDFLEELLLFCNQAHVTKTDNLIKDEIKKLIGSNLGKITHSDAAAQFLTFIKTWAKTEAGASKDKNIRTFHTLTKSDITSKLTEILLEPYTLDFSKDPFSFYDCPRKMLWNQIAKNQTVSVVDSDDFILNFLKQYIGSEVRKYCSEVKSIWANDLSGKSESAFYECTDLQTLLIKLSCSSRKMTIYDVYKCLYQNRRVPLLLLVDDSRDFDDIIKVVKLKSCIAVIIKNESLQITKTNYFVTLHNLPDEHKREILNLPVNLQGRPSVTLQNLIEKSMHKFLKCRDVIQILCGNFNVGYEYEPLFKYFINRSLSRIFLYPEVLHRLDETYIIEDKSGLGANLANYKVILEDESLKIESLIQEEMVHKLVYHDPEYLEWKHSYCSTENLKEFIYDEEEFWEDLNDYERIALDKKVQVISAAPGMGKTVLTDFIALRAPVNFWVLKIVLNRHKEYFDTTMKDMPEVRDHLKFFNESICKFHNCTNVDLAEAVFEKFLKTKKVLVLLDGFDEIAASYKHEVTEIINSLMEENFQTYITTRPSMATYLEETCKTIARTLKPFSMDDQRHFLQSYFLDLNLNFTEAFVEEILEAAGRNLNDKDCEFTGIPLQTLLLAEVFSDQFQSNSITFNLDFDLVYLYEQFIRKKIDILCGKFGSDAKYTRAPYEKCLKLFALKFLFPKEHLRELNVDEKLAEYYEEEPERQLVQRDGIIVIESSRFEFVHRTFAEFLAAQWLSENFNSKNKSVKKTAEVCFVTYRFHDSFDQNTFLFKVFDSILAKDPLHVAIINENVDKVQALVKEKPESVDVCDGAGRNALHLIALYANNGMSYVYNSFEIVKCDDKFADVLEDVPNVANVKDDLSHTALDYAVLKRALAVANKMCEKSSDLRITVDTRKYKENNDKIITELLKNSATLEYTALLKKLLVYVAYRDLLENLIKEDVTIKSFCKRHVDNFHELFNVATVPELFQCENSYYTELCLGSALGTPENIRFLLSKGALVNMQNIYNNSPIHYATMHDRSENLQLLISKGAKVNQQGHDGNTPAHYAAQNGHAKILKSLMTHKANVNKPNDKGQTPLLLAVAHGHTATVEALLSKSTCIDTEDKEGTFPLYAAATVNNTEIARNLLERGADIDKQNKSGCTALHAALENYRNVQVAELLMEYGADCGLEDNKGYFPLLHAAGNDSRSIVETLLENGVDVNQKTEAGTALETACIRGHLDMVDLLLSQGAEHNYEPSFLHFAALKGWTETVEDFLDNNVSVDVGGSYGKTPLLISLEEGHEHIAKLLLAHQANVKILDVNDTSCLHYAAKHGYEDIATELLNKGANVNQLDILRQTPMSIALQYKRTNMVKLLLAKGADYLLEDQDGNFLLHHAAQNGNDEIVAELLAKNVDVNKQNKVGNSALLLALKFENVSTAEILLPVSDVNIENSWNFTCLHYAAKAGCDAIVAELISKGLDVNKINYVNCTPLEHAIVSRQFTTAKLLLSKGTDVCLRYNLSLHIAAETGDTDIVLALLDKVAHIDTPDSNGNTSLFLALQFNNVAVARLLIEKGASITIKNKSGNLPLHHAAHHGCHELLPSLMFDENCISDTNCHKQTPLHVSVHQQVLRNDNAVSRQVTTLTFLLENGARVNVQDEEGNTALHYAHLARNFKSYYTTAAEEEAVMGFYKKVVKLLLDKGADASLKNNYNKTASDLALAERCTEVAGLLKKA